VITGNCNLKNFLIFRIILYLPAFICIFSLILEMDFLFCIRKAKKIEKYEMCIWLVIQTTPASS